MMDLPDKISTSPAANFYGWLFFALNLLLTAYVSTLMLIPLPLSGIFAQHFNFSNSTIAYAMTCYAYSFGVFLIPISLLIDRYSKKWLIALGVFVTGIGAVLLSQSIYLLTAIFARTLMGLGATVGFVHGVKCLSDWFAPKKFALLVALFGAFQLVLILLAISLFTHLLRLVPWQPLLFYYGLCSVPLAVITLFSQSIEKKLAPPFRLPISLNWKKSVCALFDSSQIWFIGATTGFFGGVVFVFVCKWSVVFFQTAYLVQETTAGYLILIFCLGYLIGSFFFSYMSNSLERRKMFLPWGLLATLLMLIIIIYPPYLPIDSMLMISFLFGFASASSLLGYTVIHEQNFPQLTATAIAGINAFFALAIAFTDPFVDFFLNFDPTNKQLLTYNLSDFQIALFRIPVYIGFCLFFSFFVRETNAKQRLNHKNDKISDQHEPNLRNF